MDRLTCKILSVLLLVKLLVFGIVVCEEQCVLHGTKLWCSGLNQTFIKNNLKSYINSSLTEIHINGGTFKNLPQNAFSNCSGDSSKKLTKLVVLNLSNNTIEKIHGKTFHCMPNLRKLILSNNRWKIHKDKNHMGYLNNIPRLEELDMTKTFYVPSTPGLHVTRLTEIFNHSYFPDLKHLKLGSNEFTFLGDALGKAFCDMNSLTTINLSNNGFHTVKLSACFTKSLQKIVLSDNLLNNVDKRTMDVFELVQEHSKYNFTVDLFHNEWDCDCHIAPFQKWLKTTKVYVMHKTHFMCHDGKNLNKTIWQLSSADMTCPTSDSESANHAGVVVIAVLLTLIGVAVITAIVMYRKRITSFARGVKKSLTGTQHGQYSSVDTTPLA